MSPVDLITVLKLASYEQRREIARLILSLETPDHFPHGATWKYEWADSPSALSAFSINQGLSS